MAGLVIVFPAIRSSAYRRRQADRMTRLKRGLRQRKRIKAQVERITALLENLEGISVHSSEVPSAMLMRARASISRAEQVLGLRDVAHSPATFAEDEGDPQPHVDREVLERLFHYRDPHQ